MTIRAEPMIGAAMMIEIEMRYLRETHVLGVLHGNCGIRHRTGEAGV
jgi:hypothetical protein